MLSEDLQAIDEATSRVVRVAASLEAAQVRQPSLLPGWSVGHVLTHIARNADGLLRLVYWAETGLVTPMYASVEARAADIEAGSGRPAAEIADDVRTSAAFLRSGLGRLATAPDEVVDRLVLFGAPRPGSEADMPGLGGHLRPAARGGDPPRRPRAALVHPARLASGIRVADLCLPRLALGPRRGHGRPGRGAGLAAGPGCGSHRLRARRVGTGRATPVVTLGRRARLRGGRIEP